MKSDCLVSNYSFIKVVKDSDFFFFFVFDINFSITAVMIETSRENNFMSETSAKSTSFDS